MMQALQAASAPVKRCPGGICISRDKCYGFSPLYLVSAAPSSLLISHEAQAIGLFNHIVTAPGKTPL